MSCDHRKLFSGGWYWELFTLFQFLWWSRVRCSRCWKVFWIRTSVLRKGGYDDFSFHDLPSGD